MKTLINQLLKGKIVLLFFIISSSLYFLMLFVTIPHLHKISGGIKILDMLPAGYNNEYVKKLMEALGQEGRHYYLLRQLPIDLFFPFFFAVSNGLIIAWFISRLIRPGSNWIYLSYIPLPAGFFDYCENFSIIRILCNYPEITEHTVKISNYFSILKSTTTTLALAIMVLIILVWGIGKIKNQKNA
jgi:hypothetical protein